ncbi:hydantoinase B/oxoprolinase family protein [Rubellicoccus peritrichatus]|uniref:Hydantoinase B/oxoprolinase family protein n=1 Tax=Rubellicoccus peritrichatus TaxID=3080537 RepID=A0AAQ3LBZ2_9BACT|nr:hydantoinase B/oxoprolinase family protein [Puniceicoccus sp. CR14]WOO41754.1 hydantoinase B/oxoprolinase family protein [Puniceicoccus sp. CR14]
MNQWRTSAMRSEWHICADTGGTFTDLFGVAPDGRICRAKVLSTGCLRAAVERVDGNAIILDVKWDLPDGFFCRWHIRDRSSPDQHLSSIQGSVGVRIECDTVPEVQPGDMIELSTGEPAPILGIRLLTGTPGNQYLPPHTLRLATTRGTNALLERKIAPTVFFVSEGFADLLEIGDQRRPDLFALDIKKPLPLYSHVVEVPGRLDASGKEIEAFEVTESLVEQIRNARMAGAKAAAVSLLNSYRNPAHERTLADLLRAYGFEYVALSSEIAPFVKVLPRAQTTVVDACLGPIMDEYLGAVSQKMDGGRLLVMTSAGGLLPRAAYRPKDSLLSGPAGGLVGASASGKRVGRNQVIAFDMGGTSTDVSRCENDFNYQAHHTVADATILSPALPIETVAAGGGSICGFDGANLFVGPESAGADPGPACYGAGGPLALTDVHLLLGRLRVDGFGIPVFPEAAEAALQEVVKRSGVEREALLAGFLDMANERMADAIRRISVAEGYDPTGYALVAFGGAGGLHACAIAELLGMQHVIVPRDAGLLSAFGLDRAVVERIRSHQVLSSLSDCESKLGNFFSDLESEARDSLVNEGFASQSLCLRKCELRMRFMGQEADLTVEWSPVVDVASAFHQRYAEVFGYVPEGRELEVVSVQAVVSTSSDALAPESFELQSEAESLKKETIRIWSGRAWCDAIVCSRDAIPQGATIDGPAVIHDDYSALVVEPGWQAVMGGEGTLKLAYIAAKTHTSDVEDETVRRELFTNRFRGIVEEMGEQLKRTALSTNVKERMDYSCALLDTKGRLIVNAPHIPVHLGALGLCVRQVVSTLTLGPGDVAVTNHPGFGGSHLPDITVISPVFDANETLLGYVANRAHHAEVGGKHPGSTSPDATCLGEEGVVIAPMKIFEAGKERWDAVEAILTSGPFPSRSPEENIADLRAQVASNRRGAEALCGLAKAHGNKTVAHYMQSLTLFAQKLASQALLTHVTQSCSAVQSLDDGERLSVSIKPNEGRTIISFAGTSPRHQGNFNATPAIVQSAVAYVLRLLVDDDLPLNDGLLGAVKIVLPECLLNPGFDGDPMQAPAVVGGNTETSQRLVDTLLLALGLTACSQGTMNNLIFGDEHRSYYETICGGSGAGKDFAGQSAVHTHMTNTAITDPEIMEHRYPVRLRCFAVRRNSGGKGLNEGGDGVVRAIEFLAPMSVSMLTQHRIEKPYGLEGGGEGMVGAQKLLRQNDEVVVLDPSFQIIANAGDILIVETPGGGGWGQA